MRMPSIRRGAVCLLALGMPCAGASQSVGQVADLSFLLTRAEATGYRETTRYDEAMGFLEVLAAQDPMVKLEGFGYSVEGRLLPLVVYGDVPSADAATIRRDGRIRVFVQANIHAGEVCGKEAMLAMLRDLVAAGRPAWSDSVLLLVAPIYNADGNERVSLYNRPRQNGPEGGMGQRANAQDMDLNRDHVKLSSPEARALVRLLREYDPHVVVDLHTTNGTVHGYHVTYAVPMHPNTDPAITGLLRGRAMPEITDAVRQRTGWDFYYYGNLPWPRQGGERGWYTYDHRPRFNTNYVGLRGRLGILSEAYAYAPFRERVLATRVFVEEIVSWVYRNGRAVRDAVRQADSGSAAGTLQAVRAEMQRSTEPAGIILGGVDRVRHPGTGAPVLVMNGERTREEMPEYGSFRATETVAAPLRYLVPATEERVRSLLEDHGIRYDVIRAPGSARLEVFRTDSTRVSARAFQGVQELELFGAWEETTVRIEEGTLSVPVDQPLGRLAFVLLEPRSDDGAANWALVDGAAAAAGTYPIMREPVR